MILPAGSSFAARLLAIEIGGTKLQLVVGTREGLIVERRRFTVEGERGAEGIRECIAAALPELVKQWTPQAIGVGYGGPVNWRTGRIVKSYHLSGWNDFPLAEWLRDLSGLPVFVENDGNVAADVLLAASVSGNSPNLVKAFEWANEHGLETAAIVGAKRGKLAEVARQTIVIEDTHYGRVEDVQMHILHMLCYAFMEVPEMQAAN